MPAPNFFSSKRGDRGGFRARKRNFENDEFSSKTIEVNRVARMVAGGRRFRFRALVAVGDRNGRLGLGLGKGFTVAQAVQKASRKARASLISVPRVNGTIPRDIYIKNGASKIILRPARPGHGVVAGGVIRTLCDLSGITDISAKILSRSSNNFVNVRTIIKAFSKLSDRTDVARKRKKAAGGIKV